MSINWNKRKRTTTTTTEAKPIDLSSNESARFFVRQLVGGAKFVSGTTEAHCQCQGYSGRPAYFISASKYDVDRALVVFGKQCGGCLLTTRHETYDMPIPATTVTAIEFVQEGKALGTLEEMEALTAKLRESSSSPPSPVMLSPKMHELAMKVLKVNYDD